jgi:hypothetical protein
MKNKGRKLGNCKCDNCGIEFEKAQSEINRNLKLNRKNFCTRTCVGKFFVEKLSKNNVNYDISKHSSNRKDGLTKFRYHYRNIKNRDKEIGITIEDLKEIWELQNGICPYLGIKLTLSAYTKIKKCPIESASIDRIDSSKGYIKGNIQWISRAINHLKGDMSEDELLKVFDIIFNKKRDSIKSPFV